MEKYYKNFQYLGIGLYEIIVIKNDLSFLTLNEFFKFCLENDTKNLKSNVFKIENEKYYKYIYFHEVTAEKDVILHLGRCKTYDLDLKY